MSQIDAFAISKDMMTTESAIRALVDAVQPVAETETLPLLDALGRVLAEDVRSDRDNPPHDNSAVDGYALRHGDLSPNSETRLPITLRIPAGAAPGETLAPGCAARIFTGAPVPLGADTIIPQEPCRVEGQQVTLPAVKKPGQNLRKRGEDFVAGDVVMRRGALLRPQELGMAASVGRAELTVYRRPRIAIFSTGNEIRDPGGDAGAGCIFDSNRFSIMGLVRQIGAEPVDLGILPDTFAAVHSALEKAQGLYDLVLTSGGVSTGDEDHVKNAVEALGALDFWRVAIRPGRPLAFGRIGITPFLGLPGNPVAAMVCFMIFARPLLLKLAGRASWDFTAPVVAAGFSFKKRPGRREWLRGWVEMREGIATACRFSAEGSGILTSMVEAQGLIELPEDLDDVQQGTMLRFLPFAELYR